jgi:hypothetical protein
MPGLGNAQLHTFVESRGDTGGAYSGAREDSVRTQYDAAWVPTFRRAKLLHLQINPRRDQPALSQQVGYTRVTENKLSETWVGFTCSSLHGVTCHRSPLGQYAFSNRSRHAPGLTYYQFNTYREPLFSGQKWLGHEIDGIRSPRAEVKNTWSSASTPSRVRYIGVEFLKL